MSSPTEIMLVAIATSTCFSSLKGSANRRFASDTRPYRHGWSVRRAHIRSGPFEQSRSLRCAFGPRNLQAGSALRLRSAAAHHRVREAVEITNKRQVGIGWVFKTGRLSLRSVFLCNVRAAPGRHATWQPWGFAPAPQLRHTAEHCVHWMVSFPRKMNPPVRARRGKNIYHPRLNSALICVSARRTVAVEATIFGRIVLPSFWIAQSSSSADSYSPTMVPSGPEIR